ADLVQNSAHALSLKDIVFQLKNPDYRPPSEARYTTWTLETSLKTDQTEALLKDIQSRVSTTPVFPSSSEIGSKVARDTQLIAVYALLASMLIIVVYIWIRFQNVIFGLAAVLALVHDVLVTIAFLALSKYMS